MRSNSRTTTRAPNPKGAKLSTRTPPNPNPKKPALQTNTTSNTTKKSGTPTKQRKIKPNASTIPKRAPTLGRFGGPQFPQTSSSKPRHVHLPSKIDNNLKRKSPWYQAIMNPSQGSGVKIPDDVSIQTGTVQCVLETNFTVGSHGYGGFRAFALHPNLVPGSSIEQYPGLNVQNLNPESTTVLLDWQTGYGLPTNETLNSYSVGVRVVSAGLYVQPETSLAQATGEMILGYEPWDFSNSTVIDTYRNQYGSSIMPLNQCKAMKTLWTPVSFDEQTYSAFYHPNRIVLGTGPTDAPLWSLFCLANGVAPNSTFRVRLVVNYEFIPETNAIDILSANPSPCDSTDVDLTEAWVAETPPTMPASTSEMSRAPGASIMATTPQDGGETGFGMFFDVLKELAPLAIEGLALL